MALVNTSLLMKEIETLPPSRLEEDAAFEARLKAKRSVPETMLLSEASLAKDWDTPEEDAAWAACLRCQLAMKDYSRKPLTDGEKAVQGDN